MMELLVGGSYLLGQKIGCGSFGDIHLGIDIYTNVEVAIKLESIHAKHHQLAHEYSTLRSLLGGSDRDVGIPRVYWFGREGDYYAMVMDILGPSLHDLYQFCNKRFTLKTILLLADQLLTRLEYIHERHILHRDLKPENFLIGLTRKGKENQVYIIDFGLSKRYRDPRTHEHISCIKHNSLTGTARYASVRAHLGWEQSRRDDLESLGYVLMYFNRGSLPWKGLKGKTKKEKYNKIAEKKMRTSEHELCKNYPLEFTLFFKHCGALCFKDKPDYTFLKRMFQQLYFRQKYPFDYQLDWNVKNIRTSKAINRKEGIMKEYIPANSKKLCRGRNLCQTYQQYTYLVAVPLCFEISDHRPYDIKKQLPIGSCKQGYKHMLSVNY